jgi:hypothetical protein
MRLTEATRFGSQTTYRVINLVIPEAILWLLVSDRAGSIDLSAEVA